MKIYTRTGDDGETGLFRGPRVRKDNPRIEAYGSVDELNAVIGLILAEQLGEDLAHLLEGIQRELFAAGAELATPDPDRHGTQLLGERHIEALESAIDVYEEQLPELRQFILPGGSRSAALLHLARTVCRRAERGLVTLQQHSESPLSSHLLRYFNRLSDLLFVLGRVANQRNGGEETGWSPEDTSSQ